MSKAAVIIDYYARLVEDGKDKMDAMYETQKFMERYESQMDNDEYIAVFFLVNRLSFL